MLGVMPTEKLKGLIALASNSPGTPTGYGQQTDHLVRSLVEHGVKTAVLSNYGLEGSIETIRTKHGDVQHYPRGVAPYSQDVLTTWFEHFRSQNPGVPGAILTLYDVWVYNGWKDEVPVISWVPLDHVTMPPGVASFLKRDNVTPVAMSPFGKRQLDDTGIDSVYIPHAIDTNVYKKTDKFDGTPTREFMGVDDDTFLVGMVAANKANGLIHRKSFAENLLAFSMFHKKFPDSHLYLHTDPAPVTGGFDLKVLLKAAGVPPSAVTIANREMLRVGYSRESLAALYSAFDVLLATSYGEGFGVPTIEAQACGTRVIASGWAASTDLVSEDSWLVDGQPFWDEPQKAFFQIPNIGSIVSALEQAYHAERGFSPVARKFALDFSIGMVFDNYWVPFLKDYFRG
jgi:glycosyltransferase involved in cell wall biosynthesis